MAQHAHRANLAARVEQIEAAVSSLLKQNEKLKEMNADLEERLLQATAAEAVIRRARYDSTAPSLPAVPAPRRRRPNLAGLHVVRSVAALIALWLLGSRSRKVAAAILGTALTAATAVVPSVMSTPPDAGASTARPVPSVGSTYPMQPPPATTAPGASRGPRRPLHKRKAPSPPPPSPSPSPTAVPSVSASVPVVVTSPSVPPGPTVPPVPAPPRGDPHTVPPQPVPGPPGQTVPPQSPAPGPPGLPAPAQGVTEALLMPLGISKSPVLTFISPGLLR